MASEAEGKITRSDELAAEALKVVDAQAFCAGIDLSVARAACASFLNGLFLNGGRVAPSEIVEAIEPFADLYVEDLSDLPDDTAVEVRIGQRGVDYRLTLADIRRAHAAHHVTYFDDLNGGNGAFDDEIPF